MILVVGVIYINMGISIVGVISAIDPLQVFEILCAAGYKQRFSRVAVYFFIWLVAVVYGKIGW